ncbi:DNA gyrase subunit A [Anaerocolumna cellulosilytica]|uniref:DNA gyrase subunit A n=1 Tax=Anaerocolumna cellulosilytica TaxID=433286 RepID=A0A6S6QWY9_9FIRM|nr:DNA gyrase subunit A [Anaerocolumna cellulosilytica]MBB5195953.1 DNA gyrase subunit A [Anaerocolumna cellulosilytica]BCJ92437.1 DNA gyrase subunit A [Anaerocolumna cellulosilytica]
MDENIFDKVHEVDLKKTMETSYIDYAMSVIAARALPDVRDGLKPVQRRILYAMIELNNGPDKPHRKCARIVGDTMGKYHPHGDSSIYEALVKLAQDFSTRYPLIDGHGNFGSVDGDEAAAMRYTEARLSKISMEMISDINKDTVNFIPNFDETEKEPTVLPSRYPNLLVNGTSGIAVGMATNIPPHNLREIVNAVLKMIDNTISEDRDTTLEELLEIVKGPDFPTGATILGTRGINEAYRTGRGKIRVRAVTDIEAMPNGKNRIVVTELPYMVNKARLIEKIAELVKDKKIDGITELRDESDRTGMRICIELRRDVNANVLLNQLYKHTQLQDTFGVIMLALVDNEPRVLNLHDMLHYYILHQEEVVTRRIRYDLNKAEERAHILKGLLIALDNIDEVINIIRSSKNGNIAKERLIERFALSEAQAQAIIDMRLRALTGLERERLETEYAELMEKIAEYKAILADHKKLLAVIREELTVIMDKFGDDRRTSIGYDEYDLSTEDLIPNENTVLAMTRLGYIKRMTVDNFKSQHRGGKGIKGMQTIDEDFIEDLLMTTTHHYIMFFTNKGRVYRLKAYEIPESGRTARGTAIINLLQLLPEERITAIIPLKEYQNNKYLFMATKKGIVKKTPIKEYENIRKSGLQAINLREDDDLIEVKATNNQKDIILVTKHGQCIRFNEKDVRKTGRTSMGVIGMNLEDNDEIIGMQLSTQGKYLLFVSEKGMGKRTDMDEFTVQRRGGKGVKCYKITEKTGYVIGVKAVDEENEIMIITTGGIIIRLMVNGISNLGRITSGVKLIDMSEDITVASFAKVRDNEKTTEEEVIKQLEQELENEIVADTQSAEASEEDDEDYDTEFDEEAESITEQPEEEE